MDMLIYVEKRVKREIVVSSVRDFIDLIITLAMLEIVDEKNISFDVGHFHIFPSLCSLMGKSFFNLFSRIGFSLSC